jgi:hypothetical protein
MNEAQETATQISIETRRRGLAYARDPSQTE